MSEETNRPRVLGEDIPSFEEVDELMAQWRADPCWDVEDTEGFEAHRFLLRKLREAQEDEWRQEQRSRLETFALSLGLQENLLLAAWLQGVHEDNKRLREELADLKDRLAALEFRK